VAARNGHLAVARLLSKAAAEREARGVAVRVALCQLGDSSHAVEAGGAAEARQTSRPSTAIKGDDSWWAEHAEPAGGGSGRGQSTRATQRHMQGPWYVYRVQYATWAGNGAMMCVPGTLCNIVRKGWLTAVHTTQDTRRARCRITSGLDIFRERCVTVAHAWGVAVFRGMIGSLFQTATVYVCVYNSTAPAYRAARRVCINTV